MTIEEAWNSEPAKATAFFDWLEKVKKDFVVDSPTFIDDYTTLEESLGGTVIGRVVSEINPIPHDSNLLAISYCCPVIKNALSVLYRQKPPFRLPKNQILGIKAIVTLNGRSYPYKNNGEPIPKNCGIELSFSYLPNCLVVDTP